MKGITHAAYVNERQKLGDLLPLKMPLTMGIHATNLCNYKCFYCSASQPVENREKDNIILRSMSLEDYKKCVDSIAEAGHLKLFFLAGWGEPLLHPDIAEMVRYAKEKNIADTVRIFTNGSLLTHEMSDKLIEAGLDNLKISLQGLTAEDYKKISNVDMNYDEYLENIKYFYEHKTNTVLTIKIMDIMVPTEEDRNKFREMYKDVCDEYMIDSLADNLESIDYTNHGSNLDKSYLEGKMCDTEICSVPFYRTFIDVDCQLFPCCHIPAPFKYGDVREGFFKAWNSKKHIEFLIELLKGNRAHNPICEKCRQYRHEIVETDILDDYADKLICEYEKLL